MYASNREDEKRNREKDKYKSARNNGGSHCVNFLRFKYDLGKLIKLVYNFIWISAVLITFIVNK